jgi:VWFA-related protein
VFAVLALVIGPVWGASQNDPVVRVESQLVLVDVVVNNGATAPLNREDFRILDNGQQQRIAVFEIVDGKTNPASAVSLPARAVSNRRDWQGSVPSSATVILIDRLNTPTEAQVFVNQQMRELAASWGDVPGIAIYELRSDGLRVIHDFKDDPRQLVSRVARLEPEHSLALDSSTREGGFETTLDKVGLDPQIEEIRDGKTGFNRQSADYFLNDRVLRTSASLETVVRHLEGLRGRRNLIWLSGRFPFSLEVWSRADLREQVEDSTLKQVDEIATLIRESNVAIYPVDVRGPGGEGVEVAGIAREIARATGGRSFRTNAVDEAVRVAVTDSRRIYKLGFYPSQPGKDRSRRTLSVEVRNPNVNLLYRPHYTGFGEQPAPRLRVSDQLASPLDATGLGLTAMAGPVEGRPGSFELVTIVDIADLRLVERDGKWEGALTVGLVFKEDSGTAYVIPASLSRISLSREQHETLKKTGLVLQRFLDTEGRTGAVRIVVQDQATGLTGSLWAPVGKKGI